MNRCAYQQKALVGCVGVGVGVGEMRRGDISVSDGLVCPKPRRLGLVNSAFNEPIRPSRLMQINNQQICDLKAGTELLDIILNKGSYDVETPNYEMGSSPPFFFGSPPSRASNPLIQDAQFGNHNFVPALAIPEAEAAPSPPPSFTSAATGRNYGGGSSRVPAKYGNKPAAVRIEGFNCRSNNCSISAFA